MRSKVVYSDIYDFSRLERAAEKLHLEQTEETEIRLFNLHNHLIWRSYRPGDDPETDAILSSVIEDLLRECNLDAEDFPEEFKELASQIAERSR